jgi:hypothetical protein
MKKTLTAGQGKTVPGAVLLAAVGRNVLGGALRSLAGENPGSGRRQAGSPHVCEMTPKRIRSNAVGGGQGGTCLAWDDAVMSLHKSHICLRYKW